ncbi:MAG: 3-phosphoglycerate dehydrogenase [Betaproteobacteria bacterium AqS2]|uniref:3-phosphoglycerate dehydrogenase n=1 Tax=Candidatus Amphirhobacter heronislandensis TaxID=1732024 RepID=A0A930XYI3_9GAMM|nr:3-phosphoglycerate dehydrogenase [Betaproteobacteria bacterium AqS2]
MNDASSKPLVLLGGLIHPAGMQLAEEDGRIRHRVVEDEPAALAAALPEADALVLRLARLTAEMVDAAPRLKVVSRHGVGCDNVPVEHLTAKGIPVMTTGDANSLAVAEHALFLMFAAARQATALGKASRTGDWAARHAHPTFELAGRRLLVAGCGRIGALFVARAAALGMRVTVYDPYVDDSAYAALGAARCTDLDAALPETDFLSLHLPSIGRPLVGAAQLAALPDHAILINVARGDLVDEEALAAALAEGRLAGAGLDVLAAEPYDPAHPLLALDNVVVTPHTAALTGESRKRMGVACVRNAIEVACGAAPDPAMVFNPGWADRAAG